MPVRESYQLIPMTDFVIEYYSNEGYADLQTLKMMINYAQFLKKKLSIGMFVPVDEYGNILKMPANYPVWKSRKSRTEGLINDAEETEFKKYKKAEAKCFFTGFEIAYNGYSVVRIVASYNHSIELSFNKNDLTFQLFTDIDSLTDFEIYLSAAALKSIGINH